MPDHALSQGLTAPMRPPTVGVLLAVGLHLVFFVSVPISATKTSATDVAVARATVMAVRSLEPAAAAEWSDGNNRVDPSTAAESPGRTPSRLVPLASASNGPVAATVPAPSASISASTVLPLTPAAVATPRVFADQLPAAPQYRAAGTLDPGPKPLSDIDPEYPTRAGQQQGTVVLRLLINEQGVVDNVAVVRATPAGFFEEAALEAFGKALFSPGRFLGVAVKSQITVEVEFMPINRGATVSGRTY